MSTNSSQIILAILALFQIATLLLVLLQFNPKTNTKRSSKKKIVLDTSAVIDGRILALAEAGFLNGTELISTNIILDELQYMADEGDSFKRSRARYGLEVLNKLASLSALKLSTTNLAMSDHEVDQQLLNLAKALGGQLFTVDFNLAQRARVEGVDVLSPSDLAEALKPQILPGETFALKLIQKGDDRGQAVGYLPDGTMVVAENSQNKIGQTLELKASKIIQTAGGRIVFAQQTMQKGIQRNRAPKDQPSAKPAPKPRQTPRQASRQNTQARAQKSKEDSLIATINSSNQ